MARVQAGRWQEPPRSPGPAAAASCPRRHGCLCQGVLGTEAQRPPAPRARGTGQTPSLKSHTGTQRWLLKGCARGMPCRGAAVLRGRGHPAAEQRSVWPAPRALLYRLPLWPEAVSRALCGFCPWLPFLLRDRASYPLRAGCRPPPLARSRLLSCLAFSAASLARIYSCVQKSRTSLPGWSQSFSSSVLCLYHF